MSSGDYKGDYNAPKHKSSTVRGAYMGDEDSVGVEDGLSAHEKCDTNDLHNVKYNDAKNSVSGNPRQVPKPYESKSVSEKGHSFDIC